MDVYSKNSIPVDHYYSYYPFMQISTQDVSVNGECVSNVGFIAIEVLHVFISQTGQEMQGL